MTVWTFLSTHALVLLCIHRDPTQRLTDLAGHVGLTERAAHRIVTDLVNDGYLTRTRVGRRSHYQVLYDRPLRHPLEHSWTFGTLLACLDAPTATRRPPH